MRILASFLVLAFLGALPAAEPAKDPELDSDLLDGIEDSKPIADKDQNVREYQAYFYVLSYAREVSLEALSKAARKDVTLKQLSEEPKKYRGTVIHVEGMMRKLVPYDAPERMVKEGVKTLYEAWIFPDNSTTPCCVVFSELPEGVKLTPKDDYKVREQVSCDAYFFKRYRYKASDGEKRDAPLLLGRSLTVQDKDKK